MNSLTILSRQNSLKKVYQSNAPLKNINTPDPDDPTKISKDLLNKSGIYSDGGQTYRSDGTQGTQIFDPTDDELESEYNRLVEENRLEQIQECSPYKENSKISRNFSSRSLEKVTPVNDESDVLETVDESVSDGQIGIEINRNEDKDDIFNQASKTGFNVDFNNNIVSEGKCED